MPLHQQIHIQLHLHKAHAKLHAPKRYFFQRCVRHTLRDFTTAAELTIRIMDEFEMTELNQTFRAKDYATNVLAFPLHEALPDANIPYLGDIALCAPVIEREAQEQGKILQSHWAHLVVHAVLHLLGHDHIEAHEAQQMEAAEIAILQRLGYASPY